MMILQGVLLGEETREWTNEATGEVRSWNVLGVHAHGTEVLSVALDPGSSAESLGLAVGETVTLEVEVSLGATRRGTGFLRVRAVRVLEPVAAVAAHVAARAA